MRQQFTISFQDFKGRLDKINLNFEQANQAGDSNKLVEWNNKLEKALTELSTAEEQWLTLQEQLATL
ncbi:MAG: hypothetical protein EKK54_01860 [Neisseriaceae bacterium]|nr:MAG: hypothetical protein EKK54_01860 [Neisseriaceae bacterium]